MDKAVARVKQFLILTADAGFGHRTAAKAVGVALQETHGPECAVQIVNPMEDRRTSPLLRNSQSDYDKLVRDMPRLYKLGFDASDASVPSRMVEGALTVMMFEVMDDLVRQYDPDVIVTTYPVYQAPLKAVYTVRNQYIPTITVVTDLVTPHRMWFHEVADLCLVPTEQVRGLALDAGLPAHRVQITGIPVSPGFAREQRPAATIRAELGWRPDLVTLLAVGSKRVGHLYDVLRALNHSGLPLQLAIVAGGDGALYRRLQETEWHVVTHLYNFVTHMPALLHAADCVICKAGGMIVSESLACGLPLLLVDVLPGQETGNAAFVVEGDAGEQVESPLAALETLYHWLEGGGALLKERAGQARSLGRPWAAYEVAGHAWAIAERAPTIGHAHQSETRRKLVQFLKRREIGWKGHVGASPQTEEHMAGDVHKQP
jgi:UDP-N-acetylglucosamine:LPS N-acetylglucosamine transferase